MLRQHLHTDFIEHFLSDLGGDVRLVGPVRVILFTHLVGQCHATLLVVFFDTSMPFLKEPQHRAAHRLIRVAEAKAACVHTADMGCRLQQDYGGTFTRCGDGGTESTWCGSIHNDIRLSGGMNRKREGEKEGDESLHGVS